MSKFMKSEKVNKPKKFRSIKEEMDYLNSILDSPSKCGKFKVKDEPYYNMLKRDVEYSGLVVARLEERLWSAKLVHLFDTAKLKAMVDGKDFDKDAFMEIQCDFENLRLKEF